MLELLFAIPPESGGETIGNGQQIFTAPGVFTVPADVYELSMVAIGEGGAGYAARGGGSGGDLRWLNGLKVKPGDKLTITTGKATATGIGQTSKVVLNGINVLVAKGGDSTDTSTSIGGNVGGGNGGVGSAPASPYGGCGGGTGGYAGNGGNGAVNGATTGTSGDGGAGGGGANYYYNYYWGSRGGSVGLLGQGDSGRFGTRSNSGPVTSASGQPGSGGTAAAAGPNAASDLYGAGAGGPAPGQSAAYKGGIGAVRIIWGVGRKFPSTLTGNL